MANETNKTTEILEFQVKQGDAITELERTKKSIIDLKEQQRQLNDAYKKGAITQDEYAKELVRVEAILKKEASTYNTLQKSVTGVQTETSKLIKSNKELSQSLKDSTSQISIAGVNVGQLTNKITALANPVTASIALVAALGAAYARSTIGAKDLAFAQSQLSSAITIVTNDFAELFSSAEDGEGIVSRLTDRFIAQAGILAGPLGIAASGYFETVAAKSKEVALAQEQYEDLLRDEIAIRGDLSQRLADNQELLTLINDEQTTFEEKLKSIDKISENLKNNRADLLGVLNDELFVLNQQLEKYPENEELQTKVLEKKREIDKLIADSAKKLEGVNRLEDNIRTQNQKQAEAAREKAKQIAFQNSELERQARIAGLERQYADNRDPLTKFRDDVAEEAKIANNRTTSLGKAAEALAERVAAANKKQANSNAAAAQSTENQQRALQLFSSEAGRLYATINQENRYFAAAQLAVDAGLTLSAIERNSQQLGPKAAGFYKAAAYLSAGASLAQAAKLIGTTAPSIQSLGATFTSTSGEQYVIQNGEAVPLAEAQRKAARGQNLTTLGTSTISGASAGAAIGSVVPGIGTAVGAAVGAAVGLVAGIFQNRRRRRSGGFAEGGYTGDGHKYQPAGIVHAGEVVWSQKDVKAVGGPAVANSMRPTFKGYADGGLVRATESFVTFQQALEIARAFPIIVDHSEWAAFESGLFKKASFVERTTSIKNVTTSFRNLGR